MKSLRIEIHFLVWQFWPLYSDGWSTRYVYLGPLFIRWDTGK